MSAAPTSRAPITVLLVDDQPFVADTVGLLLATERDIEIRGCQRAIDAVALASELRPSVILQDLVMPDVDGLTLVGLYRRNPATADTPVVVLSGNDDAGTRTRALAAGASDFLVKLPAKADLVGCIRRHAVRPQAPGAARASVSPAGVRPSEPDPGVMAQFRAQFVGEAAARVETLTQAAGRNDRVTVKSAAHALKGSSAIMGEERLVSLCREVEDQLSQRTDAAITPLLLAAFGQEIARLQRAGEASRA